MLPTVITNIRNCLTANSVLFCQLCSNAMLTHRNSIANSDNIFLGENVFGVSDSPQRAALFGHVPHIVRSGAQKQMIWIAAWRVIALMQNQQIFRVPVRVEPYRAMRFKLFSAPHRNTAVTVLVFRPAPQPAAIFRCNLNAMPKVSLFTQPSIPRGFRHSEGVACLTC